MKYVITIFIIFLTTFLFSQKVEDLNEEERKEYNRNKLAVEVIGSTSLGRDPFLGTATATTTNKWTAYKGFNSPISEYEFFSIAGYNDEAGKAKQYMDKATKEMWIGTGLMLGGMLGFLITTENEVCEEYTYIDDYCYTEYSYPLMIPGLIATTVGTFFGYSGYLKLTKNWAPYATVKEISDEYNRQLIIGIRGKF